MPNILGHVLSFVSLYINNRILILSKKDYVFSSSWQSIGISVIVSLFLFILFYDLNNIIV